MTILGRLQCNHLSRSRKCHKTYSKKSQNVFVKCKQLSGFVIGSKTFPWWPLIVRKDSHRKPKLALSSCYDDRLWNKTKAKLLDLSWQPRKVVTNKFISNNFSRLRLIAFNVSSNRSCSSERKGKFRFNDRITISEEQLRGTKSQCNVNRLLYRNLLKVSDKK